jgi:hypothetical protein
MTAKLSLKTLPMRNLSGRSSVVETMMRPLAQSPHIGW